MSMNARIVRLLGPLGAVDYGPFTIEDAVRWAGVQENFERLHYDREYAQERGGLTSFVASGQFREVLVIRSIAAWLESCSPVLMSLEVKHLAPTSEGDSLTVQVKDWSFGDRERELELELVGKGPGDLIVLEARCRVQLEGGSCAR